MKKTVILLIVLLVYLVSASEIKGVSPDTYCSGGDCNIHFMHQSSGSRIGEANFRTNIATYGYTLSEYSIPETCPNTSSPGNDGDSPDCFADHFFSTSDGANLDRKSVV